MKRRDFLRYGLTAGGLLLAAPALAIPNRRRANLGVARSGSSAGTAWSTWDETTEAGLANANIFACLMENAGLDGNETGQGLGLVGADLVLTCTSMAGAVGGTRQTNVNSLLAVTEGFLDKLFSGDDQWTLIWKMTDLAGVGGASRGVNDFLDNDSGYAPLTWQQAGINQPRVIYQDAVEATVVGTPQNSGVVYWTAWKEKSGSCWLGYKNDAPKPTAVSQLTAKVDQGNTTMPNIIANWLRFYIFGSAVWGSATCKLHYIVASKTFLF